MGPWIGAINFMLKSCKLFIAFCTESLPKKRPANHIDGQILRGGTSPAPNYGELFGTPGSYNNLGADYRKAFDGDVFTFFDYNTESGGYTGTEVMNRGKTAILSPLAGIQTPRVFRVTINRGGCTISGLGHGTAVMLFDMQGEVHFKQKGIVSGTIRISQLPRHGCYIIRSISDSQISQRTLVF